MEFYHIAIDVFKEKPLLGLGFNTSIERFIPRGYVPKSFPRNSKHSFKQVTRGIKVFDNIYLCFIGEAGVLFTISYIGLIVSVISLLLGSGYIIKKVISGLAPPGWTSLIVLLSFYNSLILLMFFILGIYISRLLKEVVYKKQYSIKRILK